MEESKWSTQAIDGMGVDFVDAFNDGGTDLFVSDNPVDHLFLHWNAALGQCGGPSAIPCKPSFSKIPRKLPTES